MMDDYDDYDDYDDDCDGDGDDDDGAGGDDDDGVHSYVLVQSDLGKHIDGEHWYNRGILVPPPSSPSRSPAINHKHHYCDSP